MVTNFCHVSTQEAEAGDLSSKLACLKYLPLQKKKKNKPQSKSQWGEWKEEVQMIDSQVHVSWATFQNVRIDKDTNSSFL